MAYLPNLSFGPDTRIVLIGTTHYPKDEDLLPPIPHAERNIDYLARLFKDPDICGLDDSCIVRMLDRENASEVTDDLARIAKEATDTLLVYYVGHGLYGDADTPLFLATTKTTEEGKTFNGVSVTLVKKAMRSSPARKRVLILDCCYSGRAMDGQMAPASPAAAAEPAIDIEGTYGIAAVPANAKALAPPGEKFTRFTGALVDVLEHGLPNDERVLTLEDVFSEVEARIGRKGDAPLPKRINWDKAQKFSIALNRSLHRQELGRLYDAVQGLRETLTATGARLQTIEAKSAGIEDLSARLAAVETAISKPVANLLSENLTEPRPTRKPIWERVGLNERQWDLLPAQPYKLHVKRCVEARKNGLFLLLGIACINIIPFIFPSLGIGIQAFKIYSIFLSVLLLPLTLLLFRGFFLLILRDEAKSPAATPPTAQTLLEVNEQLAEMMERRIVSINGIHLDPISAGLAMLLAIVAVIIPILALSPSFR